MLIYGECFLGGANTSARAVQIRSSEISSRQPISSPRIIFELITPIIGTNKVESVQIETGNISITLNQANQHSMIGISRIKIVEPIAIEEILCQFGGSKNREIIVMGNPPITSCHPTRDNVEIRHLKLFCTTVPAPQPIAEANIKKTPVGADFRIPNSPDNNTANPLMPRIRPIILAGVDFSPINIMLKTTAQRGIVYAIIEA